ncbi:MAG: PmoA family protein [Daejeonella sp.]|uniref:DUF6807 domain-containing protein n=1 Tax=Daejeonella sp. TaxID=2805397 RepID=UPI003C76CDCD
MKIKLNAIIISGIILTGAIGCTAQKQGQNDQTVKFIKNEADKKVDVMVDGKLFTSYMWPDNVYKPILYPLLASTGTPVTRGFPLNPREGERRDHIHQVGNWLNYGIVNGYDFWGNGSEGKRNVNGGQIKHSGIQKMTDGLGEGSLQTTASWIDPQGQELLAETTEFHFIAKGSTRIIDRITTLRASGGEVTMKDTKEGSFGIRVARQLELPSKDDVVLTEANGGTTTVKKMSNEGVTGNFKSSEGVTGEAVWGKRARWMDLYGNIGDEKISLVIADHPKNLSYPTYWHARGYGLFAANPFGVKDFTVGKQELNHVIPAGQTLTLRYRIIINSGTHLSDAQINAYTDEFAAKY